MLIQVLLLGGHDRELLLGLEYLMTHVDSGLWFLWVVFILSIIATLGNLALSSGRGGMLKAGIVYTACFGMILVAGLMTGIDFLGIKFILYYAVFYLFGWLVKWTENWWKQWWSKWAGTFVFIALVIFLSIVFNYDLYHSDNGLIAIVLRCIAGFTGNLVIYQVCGEYGRTLERMKVDLIGMYTLEIYVTHVCVVGMMRKGDSFFLLAGFWNFVASLILTSFLTIIIVMTFKAIPAVDFLFFGKKKRSGCE